MTTILLAASVVLLSYLSIYGLVFAGLGLAGLFRRRREPVISAGRQDHGRVTVLIPSYNEGEGLLDAVVAVTRQDYAGYVEARIILNDAQDSSLAHLLKFYQGDASVISRAEEVGPGGQVLWRKDKREVRIVLAGLQTKKDKFNHVLPGLETPYVAFLDADHRPTPNWLSSSVALFRGGIGKGGEVAGVQTRRLPLQAGNLPQIWDSSQNHLGNELVNQLIGRDSVFFTGTAAVFRTEVLKGFPLSDSITEDTYLSYDLWCAGYRIVYNDASASYEEVAPSFLAYIFRRRRWSAGHNQSFFSHLGRIFRAQLSWGRKAIFLLHGQFYLIPLAVWLLLGIYGIYFFRQLAANLQLAIIITSVFSGLILSYVFRQPGRPWSRFLIDWLVAFLWISPQLSILAVYIYKLIGSEAYYYILVFPYAHDWLYWHFALIAAPLAALLGAWMYFKDVRSWLTLWVVPTYIITLFFDIYAALLGLADYFTGRAHWSRIERRNSYSANLVPAEISGNLVTGRAAKGPNKAAYILGTAGIAAIFLVNDLLAVNNCGRIEPFLWPPLLFKPQLSLDLSLDFDNQLSDPGLLRVKATAKLLEEGGKDVDGLTVRTYLDGKVIDERPIRTGLTGVFDREYPLGWEKHDFAIEIHGRAIGRFSSCGRHTAFSTVLKEIRGWDLYVNGEKFLVKGIIPSFGSNQIDLEMEEGLKQIKEAGANAVRFYHGANERLLDQAAAAGLLVIDQPDRSTWGEMDLDSSFQTALYLGRYRQLVEKHAGEPYVLWDGFGNEWELGSTKNQGRAIGMVKQTIEEAEAAAVNPLTSYSTYFTFIKYPVDINGINMLDTGQTYWEKALDMVHKTNRPFYASEFGGFVAFWENTDGEMRRYRLEQEWPALLDKGAIGANFYQSHDNWAQPVVTGYNDPWKPEQPDDLRGFWDEKNQPKPELAVLTQLLSDVSVNVLPSEKGSDVYLAVMNVRPYRLAEVMMQVGSGDPIAVGSLAAGETKEVKVSGIDANRLSLRFSYTTHAGLPGISRLSLNLPRPADQPLVLNEDFEVAQSSRTALSGRLITSGRLEISLPDDWLRFRLNGQDYEREAPVMAFDFDNPYHDVDDLALSPDGRTWTPYSGVQPLGGGQYVFRFKWPELRAQKQTLVLSGLGAAEAKIISRGRTYQRETHNYRENVIPASEIGNPQAGEMIEVWLNRRQAAYIDFSSLQSEVGQVDFALDESLMIDLAAPRIFAPLDIELEKME